MARDLLELQNNILWVNQQIEITKKKKAFRKKTKARRSIALCRLESIKEDLELSLEYHKLLLAKIRVRLNRWTNDGTK